MPLARHSAATKGFRHSAVRQVGAYKTLSEQDGSATSYIGCKMVEGRDNTRQHSRRVQMWWRGGDFING